MHTEIDQAAVHCAKSALVFPYLYDEGRALSGARAQLVVAQARVDKAQAAWDAFIAPAKGSALDPLKALP